MEKVLALVITDKNVGGMLKYIQKTVSDFKIDYPPHITIRGPYTSRNISKKTLDNTKKKMEKMEAITLSQINYFITNNFYTVYISVQNDVLREMSFKRDYPMYRYGFNPHVTLCKTRSHEKANKLRNSLNEKNITFTVTVNNLELLTLDLEKGLDIYNNNYALYEELRNDECYWEIIKVINQL